MRKPALAALTILLLLGAPLLGATDLAGRLKPFVDCFNGVNAEFALKGQGTFTIGGEAQTIHFELSRQSEQAISLWVDHPTYGVRLDRDERTTRLYFPKHNSLIVAEGDNPAADSLAPAGLLARLISSDSTIAAYSGIFSNPTASAAALTTLAGFEARGDDTWITTSSKPITLSFPDDRTMKLSSDDHQLTIQLCDPAELRPPPGNSLQSEQRIDRAEMERLLVRAVRRASEVFAPNGRLLSPPREEKQVENGKLTWVEDQRLVILRGTPEQIGRAHGQLLAEPARRCMESVLFLVGAVKTIESGRWFLNDLRDAWKRLEPHIPQDHKTEMLAMADAMGVSAEEAQLANIFPELFHCSGFALWGSATAGGKLYHGRVLDYMTMIGLQDAAVTLIISPQGKHSFANVIYAGFVGCVSGMNAQQISLGEMGGRGEGNWDGVPMATLMRRALEECSTLDEVKTLWNDSPRTCEYYYVFADGKIPSAVGVAATPEKIEFIEPGASHELLGEGIKDAVVLSAGQRLTALRQRVNENLGGIDAERAMWLMCRPVAMKSNLHNVLFVPQDGLFYVANASHKLPGAERDYVRYDLNALLKN